jgi:hypothetical protein
MYSPKVDMKQVCKSWPVVQLSTISGRVVKCTIYCILHTVLDIAKITVSREYWERGYYGEIIQGSDKAANYRLIQNNISLIISGQPRPISKQANYKMLNKE